MVYEVQPLYRSQASTVPFEIDILATAYDRTGAVTWVDWAQVPNERVVNRRVVNLGN